MGGCLCVGVEGWMGGCMWVPVIITETGDKICKIYLYFPLFAGNLKLPPKMKYFNSIQDTRASNQTSRIRVSGKEEGGSIGPERETLFHKIPMIS